jgi:protein-S-isoprenylcysteine O-methyltransferase Ste14
MRTLLRYSISILLLPFLVVVVTPFWLLTAFTASDSRWLDGSAIAWLFRFVGGALIIVGFALFCWCVNLFARVGQGTLAPWDPARNLVLVGPYRFVRNPMISGVALMLAGQALLWGSWAMAIWDGLFVLINHVYFVLSEEQGLKRRFGESYCVYKANVPRWLPRRKPWTGK